MRRLCYCVISFLLCACIPATAQWKERPATGSPPNELPDRTIFVGQTGLGPLFTAALVDAESNAKKHKAIVEVQTDGLTLANPAANNSPKLGEGHIQYRLDNGPIENSTSKTWTFEHLAHGKHLIRVALAASDNHQIGEVKSLPVSVP